MTTPQCGGGTALKFVNGSYRGAPAPCHGRVVYRFRLAGTSEPWRYRCAGHERSIDRIVCEVEVVES